MSRPTMSLADWLVLCLVSEKSTYGQALAQILSPEGSLGSVWHVPKAVVYRSLAHLAAELGQVSVFGEEDSSIGPVRCLYQVTDEGRAAVSAWLSQPVAHGRDIRSELLIKLVLLDRRGTKQDELLQAQLDALVPAEAALRRRLDSTTGAEHTVTLWRCQSLSATMAFLRTLSVSTTQPRLAIPVPLLIILSVAVGCVGGIDGIGAARSCRPS